MTRVDFHFNVPDTFDYGCRLVRKIRRTGQQTVVFCDDPARLKRFDVALWSFAPLEFIPHLMASHPLAAQTPVLLTAGAAELPATHYQVLVNLGTEPPPFFTRFERVVEIVGTDDAERAQARTRYRFYKDRGYPLESHQVAA
ncbi:MAG: DNA polymerase III subunit chi [Lautropia sp.]